MTRRSLSTLRSTARRSASVVAAIACVLVIAGNAAAASWQTQTQISSNGNQSNEINLVTLDSTTAVVVYKEGTSTSTLYSRRTVNGGATWSSPIMVATDGQYSNLAANGLDVDLVYNDSNGRVWYRRSIDGGQSFDPAVAISPSGHFAWVAAVAHGASGAVAVAYEVAHKVDLRTSVDGGVSFGAAKLLATNGDGQSIRVAIGDGVTYVAYVTGDTHLWVTRSTNQGATWSSPKAISDGLWDADFQIVADGTHAYLAFTDETSWFQVRYRRTLDSGKTWSSKVNLAANSWATDDPSLGLANGILRATFTRCQEDYDYCPEDVVYYRQSSNGTSWGAPQRVSPNTLDDGDSSSVGSLWPIVAYAGDTATTAYTYARSKN